MCVSEPCRDKWSEVVHMYSPRHRHNSHFTSDEDLRLKSSQSQLDDDDEDDGAGSSDWSQSEAAAVRGRYGRRYDPPGSVVIVEQPSVTDRTYSVIEYDKLHVTTSGTRRRALPLSDYSTTVLSVTGCLLLFHCCVYPLSAVSLYYNAVVLQHS